MAEIPGVTVVTAEVPAQIVAISPIVPAPPLDPKTTLQEDLTTAGQRRINLIWEYTQAMVALAVVLANMIVGVYQGLRVIPPVVVDGVLIPGLKNEFPVILSSSLFLVVGFYFSRTNHAAIGGVGLKPSEEYKGR